MSSASGSGVSESSELPGEVTARPLPLVALAGLDTVNNAVHRAVWDAFGAIAARQERERDGALRLKLLPNTFELPVVKPKRTSYEWYIPKGILKRNWIPKRLQLVPAVIAVFYDLEWDEPQWNEKVLECASRVQSIRAACSGHGSRAAVVVLQSAAAPPPSELPVGAERAQQLAAACELPSKALFVLGQGNQLHGCVQRLQAALLDLATSYYHSEARIVRSHREQLNRTTHQYLLVRHQFKLAFLHELKQDGAAALKHYQQAYSSLLETRLVDTNLNEVRTVAGIVHYRLCRLLFALERPRDAIAQHRALLEHWGPRGGPAPLQFEHCAWLARMAAALGHLFEEAVRAGLPASRAHHPGLYYLQAARLTARRRQAMRAHCLQAAPPDPAAPDPLAPPPEHYGQRAWRPGRLGAEPPDPQRERAGVQALQYRERQVDHSALIVSYLGAAIAQFKAFHSPRMRRQLVVEMAEEYHLSGDYGRALTLLGHMVWEYRRERWWGLATRVLTRALECAWLAARPADYLPLALQALGPAVRLEGGARARLLGGARALLELREPEPPPGLPPPALEAARALWPAAAAGEPRELTVDMSGPSFLQVRPSFTRPTYRADEPVTVAIPARLTLPEPLPVLAARVTVAVAGPKHSRTVDVPITVDGSASFELHGDKVNGYSCRFDLDPSDGGSELRIKSVSFVLGSEDKRKVVLNFKLDDNKAEDVTHPELVHSILSPAAEHEFASSPGRLVAGVGGRRGALGGAFTFPWGGPALQGESFPLTLTLTSGERAPLRALRAVVSLGGPAEGVLLSAPPHPPQPPPLSLPAPPPLAPGAAAELTFHLKASRPATVPLQVRVSYAVSLPAGPALECAEDFTTEVTVIRPFEVTAEFVSMNFAPITECFVDVPFVVVPQISVLSPHSLELEGTELEVTEGFRPEGGGGAGGGLRLERGGGAAGAHCVSARGGAGEGAAPRVGLYTVSWRRAGTGGEPVRSSCALAGLAVWGCPLLARARCPARVPLRARAALSCRLQSAGPRAVRLALTLEPSDAFMVSGARRQTVTLPGGGAPISLRYALRPLLPGLAPPPRLSAALLDPHEPHMQDAVTHLFDNIFPKTIFVVPDCEN